MFCPKCKTEYSDEFFECADCSNILVDEMPTDNVSSEEKKQNPIKKKPLLGAMTIFFSSPIFIALYFIIAYGPGGYPNIEGGILIFIQGIGVLGGVLLLVGILPGYYLSVGAWALFSMYSAYRIYDYLYPPFIRMGQPLSIYSCVLLIVGIPITYILFNELKGIRKRI